MQPLEMPDPSSFITKKSEYLDVATVSNKEEATASDDLLANFEGFIAIWKKKTDRFDFFYKILL